jgi:uncharacterized protein (TIGR00369 family)
MAGAEERIMTPHPEKRKVKAHYLALQHMYLSAPINGYYEPEIEIGEGRSEIIIAVRPEYFHAAGAVHGAVYFKLLDDAAYFAANSLLDDVFLLTVSFNIYFTRPISTGQMRSVGRVVFRSRRLFIAEAVLFDSADHEIGRGSGTFVRSQIALSSVPGYAPDTGEPDAPG